LDVPRVLGMGCEQGGVGKVLRAGEGRCNVDRWEPRGGEEVDGGARVVDSGVERWFGGRRWNWGEVEAFFVGEGGGGLMEGVTPGSGVGGEGEALGESVRAVDVQVQAATRRGAGPSVVSFSVAGYLDRLASLGSEEVGAVVPVSEHGTAVLVGVVLPSSFQGDPGVGVEVLRVDEGVAYGVSSS
jgi:hypothetical protein